MKIDRLYYLLIPFISCVAFSSAQAQVSFERKKIDPLSMKHSDLKVNTRSYGALIGVQRGKYSFLELGAEKHWTKLKLVHQRTYSLGATMEYNFKHNVIGYKISAWTKVGRINLTYGLNLCYFTDFDHSRYGAGPAVGFRLLGFHFINGYNFTTGSSELGAFNRLFVSVRYFFPLEKKIKFKKKNK